MAAASTIRVRFGVETALAVLAGVLTVVTLVWDEWIEEVFGVEPDGGDGSLEWLIVIALAIAAVAFATLARADRPRLLAQSGE